MARKKWTPQTEVTENLIKTREKRKWQLSYRRYVLEHKPSIAYARYFGLDIENLRKWFEVQFTVDLNWDNYAQAWQFDHLVPATYFDYDNEKDMFLCWNFINMRIEIIDQENKNNHNPNLASLKSHFTTLYEATNYPLAIKMVDKIETIESVSIENNTSINQFIINKKDYLHKLESLDQEEFNRLNQGTSIDEILIERELFRKFS